MDDHNNGYDPWFAIFFLWTARNYGSPMKDVAIGFGIGVILGIAIVAMSIYL